MKSSTFYSNEPIILHVVAILSSSLLMFFIAYDMLQTIDFNFISTFSFSKDSLRSEILGVILVFMILFWILSISNKQLEDATKFLFLLSLSIAAIYSSRPSISWITGKNMIEPLILVFLSLLFIESIARLQQSEKISKMENNKENEPLISSKIYYGSRYLKFFKTWLTPAFILLTFISLFLIILNVPDYIIQNYNLSGIIQDRLKYHLTSLVILLLLAGIWILNSILKKVYSSMAVGEIEKRIEVENLYNKFIRVEKNKTKKDTFDRTNQNKVLAYAKYIAIIGSIVAFGASNMDINQLYDATLHFFDSSMDHQEYTFLNELNEKIIDMEKNIYNIDEIIIELNDAIWS